jgi:hypothetical protein
MRDQQKEYKLPNDRTCVKRRLLLIDVIQTRWNEPRRRPAPSVRRGDVVFPRHLLKLALAKVARQKPVKFALDEIDTNTGGNEIVSGESIPFLAHTQSQIEILDRRQVYARDVLLRSTWRIDREETGGIEESRQFVHLEFENDGHGRVIVECERKNARYRYGGGRHNNGRRESAEYRRLRRLSSISGAWKKMITTYPIGRFCERYKCGLEPTTYKIQRHCSVEAE